MNDDIGTIFALGLGPWLTKLRGKIPCSDAWQKAPPVDEPTVRGWLRDGFNLGLRTGSRSGVIVIDDDRKKHGEEPYQAPPTGLVVATPTGGKHYYYRAPSPCPGNSAHKLAPHVDTRGEGGQVVVPPSIHPTAGGAYRFESMGEPGQWPATPPQPQRAKRRQSSGYGDKALASEVHKVRNAVESTRNDTLNRAAFSLGQLIAGGVLAESQVRAELTAAALLAGLTEVETAKTIASGFRAGAASPRGVPERDTRTTTTTRPRQADVLIPGAHVLPGAEYVEQGSHSFAADVIAALKPDSVYRRAAVLGEIHDAQFVPSQPHRMRTIVDASMRLISSAMKPDKDGIPQPQTSFRSCSRDLAQIILEYGATQGDVRNLVHIATHPVYVGREVEPARPGWNAPSGVYLTCRTVPVPLQLDTSKAVLEDLICDFPFQAESDRANFLGLMLTPILRPAINGPVPMHLITSPMERTGKTKLAEVVLGVSITGKRTPAMQLGEREEEREKRILSVLLRGQGLLHLDNLSEFLDSPSLASLLTSSTYQGRTLGSSHAPELPNGLTVVGTGNNIHATGEIAKRIVPIRLLPASDSPETRCDFRHPDLLDYVLSDRERISGALAGLVEHWKQSGRPLHRAAFGGFEQWAPLVGGILAACGYSDWLTNLREWRGEVDESNIEHAEFVMLWSRKFPPEAWIETKMLYDLAVEHDLYGWLDRAKDERGKRTAFGRLMSRLDKRVIAVAGIQYRIAVEGIGTRRQAMLSVVR